MGIHMSHAQPMFTRKAAPKAQASDPFAERLLKNWEEHHVTQAYGR